MMLFEMTMRMPANDEVDEDLNSDVVILSTVLYQQRNPHFIHDMISQYVFNVELPWFIVL